MHTNNVFLYFMTTCMSSYVCLVYRVYNIILFVINNLLLNLLIIIGNKGDPGINGTIGAQGNNGSDGQFLVTLHNSNKHKQIVSKCIAI